MLTNQIVCITMFDCASVDTHKLRLLVVLYALVFVGVTRS